MTKSGVGSSLEVVRLANIGRGKGQKPSSPIGSSLWSRVSRPPSTNQSTVRFSLLQISQTRQRARGSLNFSPLSSSRFASWLGVKASRLFSPKRATNFSSSMSLANAHQRSSEKVRQGDQRLSFQ